MTTCVLTSQTDYSDIQALIMDILQNRVSTNAIQWDFDSDTFDYLEINFSEFDGIQRCDISIVDDYFEYNVIADFTIQDLPSGVVLQVINAAVNAYLDTEEKKVKE